MLIVGIKAGLSPLTRGNRVDRWRLLVCLGPIPAHAGEPVSTLAPSYAIRAYPRSRGGTYVVAVLHKHVKGLSPLTRGNLSRAPGTSRVLGPIPAHAGEPRLPVMSNRYCRAYPRSRGGTSRI